MEKTVIKFKLIHPLAKLPKKAHEDDACYDIFGIEEYVLSPGEIRTFKTGLVPGIQKGWEMQIRPRSGLARKNGISVQNTPGTIDAPYRDEIGVILRNDSDVAYLFKPGDRIAQAKFERVEETELIEVEELDETDRKGGFGSSGR